MRGVQSAYHTHHTLKSATPLDLKKRLKDKIISEDSNKNFEKNIQKLTDLNIENIDKILSEKEKEIIQI